MNTSLFREIKACNISGGKKKDTGMFAMSYGGFVEVVVVVVGGLGCPAIWEH